MSSGDCNIVSCSNRVWSEVNDRSGNGVGCFDVEEWADTTELTTVKVAGLAKCSYLVEERQMFIKDVFVKLQLPYLLCRLYILFVTLYSVVVTSFSSCNSSVILFCLWFPTRRHATLSYKTLIVYMIFFSLSLFSVILTKPIFSRSSLLYFSANCLLVA